MTDWDRNEQWTGVGSPFETPANPPDGTKDICAGVPLNYLRGAGYGGNLASTVIVSEVPVIGAEG